MTSVNKGFIDWNTNFAIFETVLVSYLVFNYIQIW